MKPYFFLFFPVYNRIDEVIDLLESLTFQTDDDFETYDSAVNYAKDKYPNSSYKIVKVTEETLVTVLLRR